MTAHLAHRNPETAQLSDLGLVTVLLGAFLAIADFFIVNVALPTISSDLHASAGTLELVVAGYGVAYALLLVLGGRLGDLFGRRRLFMTGMALFTVTSLACGLAPTDLALVAARIAQGAAAALMVPQVLATIQSATAGRQRARAIGFYGATAGIAAIVGQLAGGAIVTADLAGTGWRPIFLVNVPIGLVGLVLAWRNVPATRSAEPARIDVPGTVLLGAAVLALLVPLTEGRALGWPAWAWVLLALLGPAVAGFALVERRLERRGGQPLVPPSLLRLAGMRRGLVIAIPFFAGFGAFMFVSAIALQEGAGLSALRSGLTLVPMALTFLVASLLTARLLGRHGSNVLVAGAILQGIGLAGLAATLIMRWPDVDPLVLAPAMLVAGFGQGLLMSPLFGFILAGVPAERAGVGTGILTTTQQTALALGVATLGTLFLSVSGADGFGVRDGFIVVLAIQIAIAVVVAVGSRGLPRPASAPAAAPAREPLPIEEAA
jgi:EmrB/QacA subfamily drug resistance transporter